jgi:hypothetical protein
MVTLVVTIGLYCPQTAESHVRQYWLHGGPFDTPQDVQDRLASALVVTDTDWLELVDSRVSRTPHPVETRWSQLELDV